MGGHEVYAYNRSEESSARAKQRVKESNGFAQKERRLHGQRGRKFCPASITDLAGGSRQKCAVYSGILCRGIMRIKKHALVKRN